MMSVPRTNLRPQRRTILQRRKEHRRTQVGIRAQLAPYAQQSRLGPQVPRIVIERRTPHRAQQHGRRSQASLHRIRRQRIVRRSQRRSANEFGLKLKLMAKAVGHRLQNENGLFGNFRTNAVARENREFQKHGG